MSTRKRRKIDKKNEIRRKIDDDAILYSFQNIFLKKIFYLILKKFDDHLKRQRNKKENDILINTKDSKIRLKKDQKITKTRKEKFVKKIKSQSIIIYFRERKSFSFFSSNEKE